MDKVITLQRGFDLPKASRISGPIPVVASSGVNGYHNESKVKGPGVLIGRSGSIGGGQFIPDDFWPLNTTLWVKDFKGHNERFIYYLLKNIDFSKFNAGASVPTLNRNHLSSIVVPLFSSETERDIANILSSYDDLIENNRRRIELLEQSARLLYKEWFVNLRFPGHEHAKVVDGVPEGWGRKPLGKTTSFLKRGITPRYDDDAEGLVINQKCIRDGRVNLKLSRRQSREFKSERQVQVGDVLVNSTGVGTLGRVAQVKSLIENCTVDTHVTIVRPDPDIPIHYFGLAVMSLESQFTTMGRGTTNQTELSPGTIGESEIMVPSVNLMNEFELFADPIYQQVTKLTYQNDKLREARDILLPKLMNGEIVV